MKTHIKLILLGFWRIVTRLLLLVAVLYGGMAVACASVRLCGVKAGPDMEQTYNFTADVGIAVFFVWFVYMCHLAGKGKLWNS